MSDDIMKMRAKAASYARAFLANKYYKEYEELYDAYLINRGISIRRNKEIIDERLINNE